MTDKKFVISLGGSTLVQEKINIGLLKEFCAILEQEIKKGSRFVVIVGGGTLARNYQKAAQAAAGAGKVSDASKDWLGIFATRLNALLVQTALGAKANPVLFTERGKIKAFGKHLIIIGTGWKPGRSTDFVAVQIAIDFGIKSVVNLGKPHFVYTANPDTNKNAKAIAKMTWAGYFKLVPPVWMPGAHYPVDISAAKLAKKKNINFIVADGNNLANFKKIIQSQKFQGTFISNTE